MELTMINPIYGQALLTVIGAILVYLIKSLVKAAVELRDDVHDLMRNHIPHIYDELKEIRNELKERGY